MRLLLTLLLVSVSVAKTSHELLFEFCCDGRQLWSRDPNFKDCPAGLCQTKEAAVIQANIQKFLDIKEFLCRQSQVQGFKTPPQKFKLRDLDISSQQSNCDVDHIIVTTYFDLKTEFGEQTVVAILDLNRVNNRITEIFPNSFSFGIDQTFQTNILDACLSDYFSTLDTREICLSNTEHCRHHRTEYENECNVPMDTAIRIGEALSEFITPLILNWNQSAIQFLLLPNNNLTFLNNIEFNGIYDIVTQYVNNDLNVINEFQPINVQGLAGVTQVNVPVPIVETVSDTIIVSFEIILTIPARNVLFNSNLSVTENGVLVIGPTFNTHPVTNPLIYINGQLIGVKKHHTYFFDLNNIVSLESFIEYNFQYIENPTLVMQQDNNIITTIENNVFNEYLTVTNDYFRSLFNGTITIHI